VLEYLGVSKTGVLEYLRVSKTGVLEYLGVSKTNVLEYLGVSKTIPACHSALTSILGSWRTFLTGLSMLLK
jgi:hypothetical protein